MRRCRFNLAVRTQITIDIKMLIEPLGCQHSRHGISPEKYIEGSIFKNRSPFGGNSSLRERDLTRQTIHYPEDRNIARITEEKEWRDYIAKYEQALRDPLSRFLPSVPRKKSYTVRARKNRSLGRPKACEVCGLPSKRICFDHCHKTGRFRGWLCTGCNTALGMAKDNPETLRKLANYLEKT